MKEIKEKNYVGLQISKLPLEYYFVILDATTEEQKRFKGCRRCGLKDGLIKIIKEYQELKKQPK